jgi:hypothetical protein
VPEVKKQRDLGKLEGGIRYATKDKYEEVKKREKERKSRNDLERKK